MDNDSQSTLDWWHKLAPVDSKFLKPITGKRYKGDSVDPVYMIRKFTEVFGQAGHLWTFRTSHPDPVHFDDGQVMIFSDVSIKINTAAFGSKLPRTVTIGPERGCDYLRKLESRGMHIDDDAYKKATTDALTKLMSRLGVCSDLYMGLHRDSKYSEPTIADNRPQKTESEWRDQLKIMTKLVETQKTADALTDLWQSPNTRDFLKQAPTDFSATLRETFSTVGATLKQTKE